MEFAVSAPAEALPASASAPSAHHPTIWDRARAVGLGSRPVRWAILGLAILTRLWWLDGRPPHFDEGVNGWFTDQMRKLGAYCYDPTNYHGPLHFYVLYLFKCLFGRNLWALRLPTSLIGVLTVDWCFRFARFFDRRLCTLAALAMTVSPGMLYFNRDAIHETWLVFFMVLGFWGICGVWEAGGRRDLWAIGLALAGMILTKETYAIHLGCLFVAVLACLLVETIQPSLRSALLPEPPPPTAPPEDGGPPPAWLMPPEHPLVSARLSGSFALQHWRTPDLLAVVGVAVFLIVFFYSGNFFYPAGDAPPHNGLYGLVTAFVHWGNKAHEGEGHNKAFFYWGKLILRNEPWTVLGLLAALRYAVPALPASQPGQRIFGAVFLLTGVIALALVFGWPDFLPKIGIHLTQLQAVPVTWTTLAVAQAAAIVLAGFLTVAGTACLSLPTPADWRLRLLAIYAIGALLAYSIIPYKTPWCIISMIWPFFFVAAAGLFELSAAAGLAGRIAAPLLGLIATGLSGWFAYDLNFVGPTEERFDYVYVQSFNDVWTVVEPLLAEAGQDPRFYHEPEVILCGSTYPLPWLLGDFDHIGYYADNNKPNAPEDYRTDFLLVTDNRVAEAEANLTEDYYKEEVHLRPALTPLQLYFKASRFAPLMPPDRQPEFHPVPAPPGIPASAEPAAQVLPGGAP